VKLSISVTNYSWPGGRGLRRDLGDLAAAADAAGLHTVWVPDHLVQVDPTVAEDARDMLEAYTTLGYLAGRTDRVRLGAMVSNASLRLPALLVKAVSSLDAVSAGRAWLGIGAGYRDDEAAAMGFDLPPVPARFERLEETLALAVRMFAGDHSPYAGRQLTLDRPENLPRPQSPPPILVGGTGERRTLPLVVRYADACNLFDIPDGGATIQRKLSVLRDLCTEAGRPYDAIEKTLSTRLGEGESADDLVDRCERLTAAGIDHLIFVSSQPWTPSGLDVLADAAPRVRDLTR